MRIEVVNNRNLLCGIILPKDKLAVGQEWAQADGVDRVVNIRELIFYEDGSVDIAYGEHAADRSYQTDSFSFQTRYCLVIRGDQEDPTK